MARVPVLAFLSFTKKKMNDFSNNSNLATMPERNPFDLKKAGHYILVNLALALCIQLFLCSACFTSWSLFIGGINDLAYSFVISLFLSAGISFIVSKTDEHFPWLDAPLARFIFDVLVVSAYTFVVSFCLATVFAIFVWDYFDIDNIDWSDIVRATTTPIYIALGITLFMTGRSFLFEWRTAAINAEQMKRERLQWQYQSLKDQLNPHFLFNSLNVLSNLVYENADQANAFIEKLSGIYRYVLDVQNEELVSLDRELAFAKNYLELQELRFGPKLKYEILVDKKESVQLPPLTLQLLLENAVKHNAATKTKPLKITIKREDEDLIISNSFNPRSATPGNSGIGLKNIRERYSFMSDRKVEASQSGDSFEVTVPLLKPGLK